MAKLAKGDRVEHVDPRTVQESGTVIYNDPYNVRVDWDNGTFSLLPWQREIPINAYGLLKLKRGAKV